MEKTEKFKNFPLQVKALAEMVSLGTTPNLSLQGYPSAVHTVPDTNREEGVPMLPSSARIWGHESDLTEREDCDNPTYEFKNRSERLANRIQLNFFKQYLVGFITVMQGWLNIRKPIDVIHHIFALLRRIILMKSLFTSSKPTSNFKKRGESMGNKIYIPQSKKLAFP